MDTFAVYTIIELEGRCLKGLEPSWRLSETTSFNLQARST